MESGYYDPIYIIDVYKNGECICRLVDCRWSKENGAYYDDETGELFPVPVYDLKLRGYNYEKMHAKGQ